MAMSTRATGVVEVIDALATVVAGLDVAVVSGDDAAGLTELFARGERLCATAKAMAARRAATGQAWARAGHRGPDQWLAQLSGSSPAAARTSLAVAEQMEAQPALAQACQAGALSSDQAGHIAAAAQVDPAATPGLVDQASRHGLFGLRDSCRQVVHAGRSAPHDQARRAGLHARRYLRSWIDPDGAGRLDARLSPDAYAQFRALLHPYQTAQFAAARQAGRPAHPDCYAADALLAALTAAGSPRPGPGHRSSPGDEHPRVGPPATVIAVIDHAALVRGYTQGGECCRINGVGPVPVATVRAMLDDAFLAAVVRDGIDIRSLAHLGRYPTAAQRTALYVRDRTCVVPGCDNQHGLQAHHTQGLATHPGHPTRPPRPALPPPPRPHQLPRLDPHRHPRQLALPATRRGPTQALRPPRPPPPTPHPDHPATHPHPPHHLSPTPARTPPPRHRPRPPRTLRPLTKRPTDRSPHSDLLSPAASGVIIPGSTAQHNGRTSRTLKITRQNAPAPARRGQGHPEDDLQDPGRSAAATCTATSYKGLTHTDRRVTPSMPMLDRAAPTSTTRWLGPERDRAPFC